MTAFGEARNMLKGHQLCRPVSAVDAADTIPSRRVHRQRWACYIRWTDQSGTLPSFHRAKHGSGIILYGGSFCPDCTRQTRERHSSILFCIVKKVDSFTCGRALFSFASKTIVAASPNAEGLSAGLFVSYAGLREKKK